MDDNKIFYMLEELRDWRDHTYSVLKARAIQRVIDKKVELIRKKYGNKYIRFSTYHGEYLPVYQSFAGEIGGIRRTVDEYINENRLGWR